MTSPSPRQATIEAPAKVNLVLRVLERDPATGYHRLETVFQAVGLTDSLTFVVDGSGTVELEVAGADVGPPAENLVTRAARGFLARSGEAAGLRVTLRKRIPAGAGLGGGSSDAAATLRALNAVFGEPLDGASLHELAASLGSDVPFFLCGSATALAWGRGDRLRPLPALGSAPVLLVLPGVHVATAEAYRALAEGRSAGPPGGGSGKPRLEELQSLDWEGVAAEAVNDFEAVVPALHAPVGRALEAVRRTGPRVALLSGSGSAVFGVYRRETEAARARATLEAQGHAVVATRTLERMPEPVEAGRRQEGREGRRSEAGPRGGPDGR